MKKIIIVITLLLAVIFPVFSDEQAPDIIGYYDTELISIGYQAFGGINLIFHGQTSSTSFGIPPSFSSALLQYEDSGESYNAYLFLNTTGNISYAAAFGAICLGSFSPFFNFTGVQNYDDFWGNYMNNYGLTIGLLIGGTVCAIISAVTLPLAQENLLQGVNQYNRHKIEEYKK